MSKIIGIDDFLSKYCFHDTIVNDITIHNNIITFTFNDGIYKLDDGKEINLTKKCKFLIELFDFDSGRPYEHIEIQKSCKNKEKSIDFFDFIKDVKENKLELYLSFYSCFGDIIMFEGSNTKNNYKKNVYRSEKSRIHILNLNIRQPYAKNI